MKLPDSLHVTLNLCPLFTPGLIRRQSHPDKDLLCPVDAPDSLHTNINMSMTPCPPSPEAPQPRSSSCPAPGTRRTPARACRAPSRLCGGPGQEDIVTSHLPNIASPIVTEGPPDNLSADRATHRHVLGDRPDPRLAVHTHTAGTINILILIAQIVRLHKHSDTVFSLIDLLCLEARN